MLRFRNTLLGLLMLGLVGVYGAGSLSSFAQPQPKNEKKAVNKKAAGKTKVKVKRLATFGGFSDWVTSVAFAPDGGSFATGSYEIVKLWDTKSNKQLAKLKVQSGFVKSLAFSPDGKSLAVGHYQTATIWDTASKKSVSVLKGHRAYVTGIAYSPDGKRLATSSEDETARVWDLADGKWTGKPIGTHSYPVMAVAFSPDGKLIATASGDETRVTRPGEVKLFNAVTGEAVHSLPDHKKTATSVAFSPDGKLLVSTSVDEKINVYDVLTGKALGFFGGHSRPTNCAVFTPNGKTVISGSGGRAVGKNEVKLWNPINGEDHATIGDHKGRVTAVALSPDGKTLATASYDKTAALWDVGAVLAKLDAKTQVAAADSKVDKKDAEKKVAKSDAPDTKSTKKDQPAKNKTLRAGIIGLDTSHVIAFTKILNDSEAAADVAGCRVVAAYPKGSPDIESSTSRVPGYTEQVKKMGVKIVDSIDALIKEVDVVFLESNDGRPHLEQVIPVLKAGKPVFIDKPIAGSLTDAVAIFELSKKYKVPLFSSSSLRFSEGAQALRNGKIGDITGCDAYSPCSLEKTHPDLFWYGIHGVETLFTVMGAGCKSVTRTSTKNVDLVAGIWEGSRIGTFRGIRAGGRGYGGTAFGSKGIAAVGKYGGYRPLLVEIVKFFNTGVVPVSEQETLEIYAFMEAADESKRQGGKPVALESVLKKARAAAKAKIELIEKLGPTN